MTSRVELSIPTPRTTAAATPSPVLPPRLRPSATLGVLDITKYFGATSGGIKTYLLEKARYVASRPWLRQVAVIPGAEDGVESTIGARTYRLRGPRIPANPPYRFLLAAKSLRRIIDHERPELIEIGSPFFVPWLARLANRGLSAPMVWYYHSHLPRLMDPKPESSTVWRRAKALAFGRYVRLLGSRFPVVICSSNFAAAELSRFGVGQAVRVPLGVDLTTFHPRRRAWAAETRRAHGLPDEPLALYAGRFAEEKRLDVILDAWPEVERRTRTRLVLLGAGPLAEQLRAHPYGGRVLWLPYERNRDALADLLAAVDFSVAPGPIETFGLSVLEALASGTPVLSVDDGGGEELVHRSGAGERYHDGDPGHAAEAAVWLSKQNLRALGERGRRYAERFHSWETAFDHLFAVYERVRARLVG